MSVDTSKWSVQQWLAGAVACGLAGRQSVTDPFASLYPTIAQRNMPASSPAGLDHFTVVMTASLIARGIIYFKNSPGDCGASTPVNLADATLAKTGGSVASAGLSIGLGAAGIGGLAAGGATLGLSVAITAVVAIFAHHDQAVANEQATICKVAGIVNQVIPQIDAAVRSGAISPSDGAGYIKNFVGQVNGQLGTIEKTCNAACFYQGILNAHADFATSYYAALAPSQVSPIAPMSAPTSNGMAPGGVPIVAASIAHTLSGVPAVTGVTLTTNDLILGAIVLLIVFIIFSVRKSSNGQ